MLNKHSVFLCIIVDFKFFYVFKGYDVNATDNGGWTPLSESVSANKIKNVRLLLEKGARVDCRSGEFLVDENDEQTVNFFLNINL